jgi:murein L,D-transpeptidase YcbB/YkuD
VLLAVVLGGTAAVFNDQTLSWIDEQGSATADAVQALSLLRQAADEGLDPGEFDSAGLTNSMLRYMEQLHRGRVDPQAVGFHLPREPETHDFDQLLRRAVADHRLLEMVESLTPRSIQYRHLRNALKTYRATDPSSPRIRQIELAMERLRWLPEMDGRVIVVNIPMFRLWAWDPLRPESAIDMAVIVGRARGLQTPVFSARLTDVVFRPYWNVPASILRNEILPAMKRDPAYLERHNMEVLGSGADMRVRQRPGPSNSLGLVKFSFPNRHGVYMHATPAVTLFHQERRDFSHGCVRVQDPVSLAEWVLLPQPGWTRAAIREAMDGDTTQTVRVVDPVTVVMFYMTAAYDPDADAVQFAPDVYRHDARLDAALKARAGGGA